MAKRVNPFGAEHSEPVTPLRPAVQAEQTTHDSSTVTSATKVARNRITAFTRNAANLVKTAISRVAGYINSPREQAATSYAKTDETPTATNRIVSLARKTADKIGTGIVRVGEFVKALGKDRN